MTYERRPRGGLRNNQAQYGWETGYTSPAHALWTHSHHSNHSMSQMIKAVRKCRSDGLIFSRKDSTGTHRYGLTDEGLEKVDWPTPYDKTDESDLKALLEAEVSRDEPRQAFVGWINRRLSEVQE